mmetsp:Transcript_15158/g.30920  ORF Transcript_15158/g.30920 Transcript_15158/m.30920 type:complete len:647 (-) Transcript_15158:197-2137(-)
MSFPPAPSSPEKKTTSVQENKISMSVSKIPFPVDNSARTDGETEPHAPSPPPPSYTLPPSYQVMPPPPPHSSLTHSRDSTIFVKAPLTFSSSQAEGTFFPIPYYDQSGVYYSAHHGDYAYAHMYPHHEVPYWQIPPQTYFESMGDGGPYDMPKLKFPVTNTHPIKFPQSHLSHYETRYHSSGAETVAYSHTQPSASSFGTCSSFDKALFDPISTNRHRRDVSGVSEQNKHLRGSVIKSTGNKKRGAVKQKRSGSNDGSTKSGSSSSVVPYILGDRLDKGATLLQIKGHVVRISKDKDGSRFIQQRLDYLADPAHNVASSNEELNLVFSEAMSSIEDLWYDAYGNFILQKLLDHGTEDMKAELGDRVHADVVSLSNKVYGCRVVQKALDALPKGQVAKLVSAFEGRVLPFIHDRNGNHVIQKSIIVISNFAKQAREGERCEEMASFFLESLDPIINEVIRDMEGLSRHPYGCRVVQRMVEYCIEPQKSRILDSIIAHHNLLVDDQYGNYVFQRSLSYGRVQDREAILETFLGGNNVVRMSMRKLASNVVEMMIKHGNEYERQTLVQEMLNSTCVDQRGNTLSAVVAMSMDAYANYVVKTAMDFTENSHQRDQLFGVLVSHLNELEEIPFAKQIVSRIHLHLRETKKT